MMMLVLQEEKISTSDMMWEHTGVGEDALGFFEILRKDSEW